MPHAQLESLEREEFPDPAAITVWATEFNIIDKTSTQRFAGTWLHGLFLAAYALLLAQRSVFTRLDLHNVVGQALQGALFDTTTAFGSPPRYTAPWANGRRDDLRRAAPGDADVVGRSGTRLRRRARARRRRRRVDRKTGTSPTVRSTKPSS